MTNVNFTVTFDPIKKNCKVIVKYVKQTEKVEYVVDDVNEKPKVKIVEISALEQMRAGERKAQMAMLVMMGTIVVGVLGYNLLVHCPPCFQSNRTLMKIENDENINLAQ